MTRAEVMVGTDIGVMARDVDVSYMLPCIQVGAQQRLEDIDVSPEEHIATTHNFAKGVEIIPVE
jgi:hypothetical protein